MNKYYQYENKVVSLENITFVEKSEHLDREFHNGQIVYYYITSIHIRYNDDYTIILSVINPSADSPSKSTHEYGDNIYNEIAALLIKED